ncbi:MAG: Na(+)/H(+) antiporter subunit D, partial [Rickettsiales bacterium]|nr:Na(+)/H(+) antiporter subunit D [Rickettsiales bacterium]
FIFPPGLVLILGAAFIPFLRGFWRDLLVLGLPVLALVCVAAGHNAPDYAFHFGNFIMVAFHASPYSTIFGVIFCLAAFGGGLFGLRQARRLELASAYLYAGAALGVVYAGDFITLFSLWELMLIGSLLVLLSNSTPGAWRAGLRYALMHLFGGVLLMAGIIAHAVTTARDGLTPYHLTIPLDELMHLQGLGLAELADWLILAGILVNAGGPLLSAWVADSYPESSPFGGVFLSAFTTKTAVFMLITLAAGNTVLIYAGLFMVFYGIIYAMLENDARRILSYSIINQVGFMVVAVGIGSDLALMGAATHAFCHIIYKGLLFMSAGSVLYMTGKRKCTELGGLYHSMRLTAICGIIGALAISAFPLTSGFVSKSLTAEAAVEAHLPMVWYLLLAASAGVFLHAGVKFPWFVFFQKDSGLRPVDPPLNMRLAMLFFAAFCILPGLFPQALYALLPQAAVPYEPYTPAHVITQLQLLMFAGLAFFVLLPFLKRTDTITLDFDWVYRVFLRGLLLLTERLAYTVSGVVLRWERSLLLLARHRVTRLYSRQGVLADNWSIGTTALLLAAMLGIYLFYSYVIG